MFVVQLLVEDCEGLVPLEWFGDGCHDGALTWRLASGRLLVTDEIVTGMDLNKRKLRDILNPSALTLTFIKWF